MHRARQISKKITGIKKILLISLCLNLPSAALSNPDQNPAPLDTLQSTIPAEGEIDLRYLGTDIDLNRKELPDVQATIVPKSKQPRTPPRLIHPLSGEWYFQEARAAAERNDRSGVKENLKKALGIEPNNVRYLWWQAGQSIRVFDTPTVINSVPKIMIGLMDSPVSRGRLVVRFHQGAVSFIAWFWTVLVISIYFGLWPNLAHDLGAMIFKDRQHPIRWWLPIMIPMAFVALRPGWLGFLALMSVSLLIQTRGKLRTLLTATWIFAIILAFPAWPILHLAPPTIDPDSEVNLLVNACRLEPSGPISDKLRKNLKNASSPERQARLRLALAIQEARRGRFKISDKLFKKVLQYHPDSFPALIGLANNTYYRGNLDTALERYRLAQSVHPDRGEVGYNMAQVYFKKLFIPEATAALEQSRTQDFWAPTHMDKKTSKQSYSPVVYPGLSSNKLWAACAFEAENYPPLISISAWQNLLGSPPLPLFLVLIVPLLLAVVLVQWWSHQNDPRECENCGLALCRDCCRVRESAWLCPICGETASRSRSDIVLATLLKNRSRDEGMRNTQRIVNLGRFLPGAGHLASEHFAAAWFRISLVAWGAFFVSSGWIFDSGAPWKSPGIILPSETIYSTWVPLPLEMWAGWTSLSVIFGGCLLALAWLVGLLDGANLRQGIPERFSWAPTPGPQTNNNPNAQINKNGSHPTVAVGPGLPKP